MFGAVKLTKNADPDKYKYSGYGIGYDLQSEFLLPDGSMGKNVAIVGGDMISSAHFDNKGKDVLILGKGSTQGSDETALTAEVKFSINFSRLQNFVSVYTIMEATVSYLLVLQKFINSKQLILKKIPCV